MGDGGQLPNGAVAVIDALGFKGIWKRVPDPQIVIATLRAAKRKAKSEESTLADYLQEEGKISVQLLSDTIVIVCTGNDVHPAKALLVVASVVAAVTCAVLCQSEPSARLAYRGCIAYGPILAEDEFFVGSAIDEAAEAAALAEAAVVWLLPSAQAHNDVSLTEPSFVNWDVPVKPRGYLRTAIVNPFPEFHGSKLTEEEIIARHLDTFAATPPVEIAIKKQNTERALRAAAEAWVVYEAARTNRG